MYLFFKFYITFYHFNQVIYLSVVDNSLLPHQI